MKSSKFFSILILEILIITTISLSNGVAAPTTQTYVEDFEEGFKLEIQVTGELQWPEQESQNINVTVIAHEMPLDVAARIFITLISIQVIQGNQPIDLKATTVNKALDAINQSITETITLDPPPIDSFHLNVTIIGSTEIGGNQSPQKQVVVQFPKEGSIIVLREELKPLIQLYGFPDRTSFWLWFRIFLVPLGIVTLQFGFVGAYLVINKTRRKQK